MTCPTIDELSQYADGLLTKRKLVEIGQHLEGCGQCKEIVMVFEEEEEFIKETLKEPRLPTEFTRHVLNELTPYPQKKKGWKTWKRMLLVAAGALLAITLSAAFNPSFAGNLSGLFSTGKVDEGLRTATEEGLTERVDLSVSDKGLTIKIEDLIADTSRIAFSYQITNQKGQPQKIDELSSEIMITDQNNEVLVGVEDSWYALGDYGLFEMSLRDQALLEKVIVHLTIQEMNGVKGDWRISLPVEFKESLEKTRIQSLEKLEKTAQDITVKLKEARYSVSSSELVYETGFTNEAQRKVAQKIDQLEKKYGRDFASDFMFGSGIQYRIENETNEVVFRNPTMLGASDDFNWLDIRGQGLESIGRVRHIDSLIPFEKGEDFKFVLEGIFKTVPTDFAVELARKDLKKNPISFEYEGQKRRITEIEEQADHYLVKSWWPIKKVKYFTITMEEEKGESLAELGAWVLTDEHGKTYEVFRSGPGLIVYGLDKMPDKFTLHLISMTYYEALKEQWEVPLVR